MTVVETVEVFLVGTAPRAVRMDRTLSVERIGKVIGKASLEELNQTIEGLNEIIA